MTLTELADLWHKTHALDNTLSDDGFYNKDNAITYRQAIERIADYQQWLNGQTFNQPIAFCCDQSVEHLLMLVALMSTELNFALLPGDIDPQDCQVFGDKLTLTSHANPQDTNAQDANEKERLVATIEVNRNQIKAIEKKVYFRTSGSLGRPKVVVHSRDKLNDNSAGVLTRLPLTSQCRVLIPVPLYHMYGFGAALWPSLLVGANIHLSKNLNMLKFKAIERQFNPDVVYLTPPSVGALLLRPGNKRDYRFIVSAGDCFDVQQFEQAKDKFNHIFNLYGSTELGVIAIGKMQLSQRQSGEKLSELSGDKLNERKTVNDAVSPLPNVDIKVDNNQLKVKHRFGFDGYLNHPNPEGYFETGDLVDNPELYSPNCYNPDDIRVIGRAKLSINREGRLIAFAELETRIKQLAIIEQAVIIKGPKDVKGHTLIAVVEVKKLDNPKQPITGEDIKQQLKTQLPLFATPSKVIIESQLPRLSNGKLNRKQIAQNYQEIAV